MRTKLIQIGSPKHIIVAVMFICVLGCTMERRSKTQSFKFVLTPGFQGELDAVEDARLPLDTTRVITLRQIGTKIMVPKGFLSGSTMYNNWTVAECVDTNGELLSSTIDPPSGQLGIRTLRFSKGFDRNKKRIVERWYFIVNKGK